MENCVVTEITSIGSLEASTADRSMLGAGDARADAPCSDGTGVICLAEDDSDDNDESGESGGSDCSTGTAGTDAGGNGSDAGAAVSCILCAGLSTGGGMGITCVGGSVICETCVGVPSRDGTGVDGDCIPDAEAGDTGTSISDADSDDAGICIPDPNANVTGTCIGTDVDVTGTGTGTDADVTGTCIGTDADVTDAGDSGTCELEPNGDIAGAITSPSGIEFVIGGRFVVSPEGAAVGVGYRRGSCDILTSGGGFPSAMGVGEGIGGIGDIVPAAVGLGGAASTCIRSEDGSVIISWEDSLMVGRGAVRRRRLAPGG